MNKILLALIVGLFAVNTYAADATADAVKAEPAKEVATAKADVDKHTAAPVKKAKKMKKMKKVAAKPETPSAASVAK
jgi:hypothetical protein